MGNKISSLISSKKEFSNTQNQNDQTFTRLREADKSTVKNKDLLDITEYIVDNDCDNEVVYGKTGKSNLRNTNHFFFCTSYGFAFCQGYDIVWYRPYSNMMGSAQKRA